MIGVSSLPNEEGAMSKQAVTAHPVHELIARRWSPYAFADRPVAEADLRSLFEAARWAASSYNEQPWSYLVARREDAQEFARLLGCLVEGNRVWAQHVPVLALGCTSLKFTRNGQPNAAAVHDLGLASATLTLEATARPVRPSDDRHPARPGPGSVRHPRGRAAADGIGDRLCRRPGEFAGALAPARPEPADAQAAGAVRVLRPLGQRGVADGLTGRGERGA
jgi:nitroreductase